jgi:prepilin-type processing-associated H-X9-DG protein
VLKPVYADGDRINSFGIATSNMQAVSMGIAMYCGDDDDRLPLASNWMDSIYPYTKCDLILRMPDIRATTANGGPHFGIALRRSLSGANTAKLEKLDQVALIFDSKDLERNASGELNLLPQPARHLSHGKRLNLIGFADGHVAGISMHVVLIR